MCFGSPHCNNHTKTLSKLIQKIPDLVVRTQFPHISSYPNSLCKLGKVSFPPLSLRSSILAGEDCKLLRAIPSLILWLFICFN